MPLLDDDTLAGSAVVANSAMNRERQLAGVNSYAKELGFNPVDVLTAVLRVTGAPDTVAWLDLCCGTGRAVIEAAGALHAAGVSERVLVQGVDLVDAFDPAPEVPWLRLTTASVVSWRPDRRYDLITSVHGLHYVGDKLAVLERAAGWLTDGGRLVADLDLASIRLAGGAPAGRRLAADLREAGFSYDGRRRRIGRDDRGEVRLPWEYLGADDTAGPGYTGQPAVHSHYRRRSGSSA
ncbi:class I SAM-dependent methyltransferase [Dactylosporangium fulvum]|uniref:Class I SAM-dependent methyltransferase n=1 Tax=Dactylosporangium fulvum TaxID=53359 RepID=A0ABY5W461_9ACTN|nr:class I SAM-dependent methyltransferase [Dactylosporangium fulvum]UWP84760.1 class I SAM-dependent methyltransferase [Dactylosporangium fulvum]